MFRFIDKDVYGADTIYTYEILTSEYDVIGKVMILISSTRHDAGVVFNRNKVGPTDVYEYLEDLRELLDADLIQIDEPHNRIIISEITYEDPKYLF